MKKTSRSRASRRSDDPTTRYAKRVVAGVVVAGPHVRDACARHLRDLELGGARGLTFDVAAADRGFRYFRDVLRLNGGEFEGIPFDLHESQEFIVGSVLGWKRADGYRRFRVAYIEEGKGNGKSPMVAGLGLYGLTADGESRAEIYAAATKKDQAQILFRDAVAMVDLSPDLALALVKSGGAGHEWNIADPQTASFFRTVSSDDSQSGPRPHVALLDEVHEHKSGLMVEMMRAGTKGRRQALIVMITNSGADRTSVCWEYHNYAAKVAAGQIEDDSFFGYVCALDPADDPMVDESCWPKANPLLGVSIQKQYLQEQVREARGMPSKESTVRRLNFCQWVEALNPWISQEVWQRSEGLIEREKLAGRKCFAGLDLSSTTDLTAFVLLFPPTDDDPRWRLLTQFWIPEARLVEAEKRDNVPYGVWRSLGFLNTTPGAAISKLYVLAAVVSACSEFQVQAIGYDRWRIEDLKQLAADEGISIPLREFGQGFKDMAPAVDEFERLLIGDALRHDGNPVMNWNIGSAVLDTDPANNRKPTKAKSTGRIDGVVAAVMAAGVSLVKEKATAPSLHFL